MSAKIKISYTTPQELHALTEMLKPVIRSCKAGKGGNGRYKRAYLDVEIPGGNAQKSADSPLI